MRGSESLSFPLRKWSGKERIRNKSFVRTAGNYETCTLRTWPHICVLTDALRLREDHLV
jgi:hypothetical protein